MSRNMRNQIDQDYNGTYGSEEELFQALEYPVGDLLDEDTYWQEDEDSGDEDE